MAKEATHKAAVAKEWVRGLVPSGGQEIGPRDQAIRRLKKSLRVEPVLETNVVQVSYQSRDPDLSQRVVSEVIDNYLEEHVRIHSAPGAHEFLMDHLERLDGELASAEKQLVDLRQETGLVSPLEQRSVLVESLGTLKSELYTLEATLAQSQAEVDELTGMLAKIEAGDESSELMLVGATSEEADGMRTQLYQLQLEAEVSIGRESRCFEVRKWPLLDYYDREVGRLIMFRDITAQKQVEEALRASEVTDAEQKLRWALDNAKRLEVRLVAKLRLARVLFGAGDHDAALALVTGVEPGGFAALYAELRGDILAARDDLQAARSAYQDALSGLPPVGTNRDRVRMKLDDLGVFNYPPTSPS